MADWIWAKPRLPTRAQLAFETWISYESGNLMRGEKALQQGYFCHSVRPKETNMVVGVLIDLR
jgi:hypothetical protein